MVSLSFDFAQDSDLAELSNHESSNYIFLLSNGCYHPLISPLDDNVQGEQGGEVSPQILKRKSTKIPFQLSVKKLCLI